MLIIGLNDKSLQERLIREPNLDLTKTKDTCRTVEVTLSYAYAIQNANILQNLTSMKIENALCNIKPNLELSLPKLSTNVNSVCIRTKGDLVLLLENLVTIRKRRVMDSIVDFVQQNMDNSDSDLELFDNCESLFIGVVEDEENYSSENKWAMDLLVNQTLRSFKTDFGAPANIIPENCFRTLKNKPKLHKPNTKLTAYNGSSIPVYGSCILNTELRRKTMSVLLTVDVSFQPVLGLKPRTQLNLIKRIMNIDKTPDSKLPSYLNELRDGFREIDCLHN